jgi:hypothetical protein
MTDQSWIDRQGDVWALGEDGLLHTPETRPFSREYVERKWGPLREVTVTTTLDEVWCLTCDHTHIARIPALTYRCADCGYGGWILSIAVTHATDRRTHVVYPLVHQTVPIEEKPHAVPTARP